uniref:Hepatocellular carcinoma-associated antigen 59-domain-containing protein n=1 Tax=Caenorhabditis tropicalis TaxID=1561998 RepID=A0A1I7UKK3_9PELO
MTDLFRKPKKKTQQTRKISVEAEIEDDQDSTRVSDIRDLQRSRERKNGLTELECAVGITKAAALEDGIQMSGGGMQMTAKKKAAMEAASIEHGLREQFEKETMLRDEHEELRKYIDDGLTHYSKDRSSTSSSEPKQYASSQFSSLNADDRDLELLKRAAGKVRANQSKKETELLSEHMLAGIPEVDLGIGTRITNILETEKKKRFLLQKSTAEANGLPPPVEESEESKPKYRKRFHNQQRR